MSSETPAVSTPAFSGRLQPLSAFRAAWNEHWRDPWPMMGVTIAALLMNFIGSAIPFAGIVFALVVTPALLGGVLLFSLRRIRGGHPEVTTLFEGFQRWAPLTAVALLLMAVVLPFVVPFAILAFIAGFASEGHTPSMMAMTAAVMLGAIGGLLAMLVTCRVAFATYVVVDDSAPPPGAIEALKQTWRFTEGNVWRLLGLLAVSALAELAGLLCFVVGIVPALAIIYLAWAQAYEQLRPPSGDPAPAAGSPGA